MLYKPLNFVKTSVMKKLITLSFFFFFVLVGNAQTPNIVEFDISDAVKVADFQGIAIGNIEKHNGEYFSLVRGWRGYHRKDTIGSQWKYVDFPDSIFIRETLFIDGKWFGFEHLGGPCRYDDIGAATCFIYTLNIYHFDFETGSLIPIHTLKNCGSLTAPTIAKTGDNLFVSFPTYCPGNVQIQQKQAFYSKNGESWEKFNHLFPDREAGQNYASFDIVNNVIYLSDTFTFAQTNKLYLPDTIDLSWSTSIHQFQDTVYIFPQYKDYFYKTGDFGTTWESTLLPLKLFKSSFKEDYIFYDGIGDNRVSDAIAYSLKDNSFYSIISDSLSYPFQGSNMIVTDKEIIGNFTSKGGLMRSFDRGKTWENYMTGIPRIGLSKIVESNGIIYGENGNWSSNDGENWNPLRLEGGIPISFEAKDGLVAIATVNKNSTEALLHKKGNNNSWEICDTLKYSNPPDIYISKEKITYSPWSRELKSGSRNCSDWKVISNEGTELSFSDFKIVINEDSLLSVGYDAPDYSLLRSFDFGNTWTTLNYISDSADDFFMLNNSIVRTNYSNGEIWISTDWGENWQKVTTFLPQIATVYFHFRPNKSYLIISGKDHYFISSNFGKDWVGLKDENILDFEFLEDSTMLISKEDGVYKMDGSAILDSLDSFKNQDVSSISETQLGSKINVYPNPVSDILSIKIEDINSELLEVNLLNQLGQIISKHLIKSFSKTHQIQTDKVPKGMFFVDMKFSDGRHSIKKIIKS